jgi:hypothetical protein
MGECKSVNVALRVLRRPPSFVLVITVTVLLTWLYYTFSLRSAGENTTIFTRTYATPDFEISHFGAAFFYVGLGLDLILAFLTGILLALALACNRSRREMMTGTVGTGATLAIAIAGFG